MRVAILLQTVDIRCVVKEVFALLMEEVGRV
jgi:hypothetical protein